MTIRCVSFNPAIDQTVTLERLVPGEVVRALAVRHDAGGKGVNVASCLADAGQAVELHGLLGRDNAAIFEQLFAAKRIADRLRRVPARRAPTSSCWRPAAAPPTSTCRASRRPRRTPGRCSPAWPRSVPASWS